MRIGLVIYGSLDTLTGGYLYDHIVARELEQRGHELEIISLPQGPYLFNLARGLFPPKHPLLRKRHYEVLLQDELCHPSLLRLNRRHHPSSPPSVAVVHHLLSSEPRAHWSNLFLSAVEKSYLRTVDGFIFNSQSTRQSVEAMVGDLRPQVVAYPAGDRLGFQLSTEDIASRCRRPGPLQLLFLGNIVPRKGILPLIETLAGIDRRLWRLSVVGSLDFDPDHAERARQRVRQLGLSDQITFLGALSEERLSGQLCRSHLFCMPFSYEGFGIAMLEAMAFGLPALSSAEGAAAETVTHGSNGFLIAPADSGGLRALIVQLHQDRDQLTRLSLEAFRAATKRPGWQHTAATIERFLETLVSAQYPHADRDFDTPTGQHAKR